MKVIIKTLKKMPKHTRGKPGAGMYMYNIYIYIYIYSFMYFQGQNLLCPENSCTYPLVIQHSYGKSPCSIKVNAGKSSINGQFSSIFHSYVKLPGGQFPCAFQRSRGFQVMTEVMPESPVAPPPPIEAYRVTYVTCCKMAIFHGHVRLPEGKSKRHYDMNSWGLLGC